MTRFLLFLCIIPNTVFLIIIVVRCSVVCYSPVIVLINVESILFIAVAIRSRTGTYHKFTILSVIGTNKRILRYIGDWKMRKIFNTFPKQVIVKIGSIQTSK